MTDNVAPIPINSNAVPRLEAPEEQTGRRRVADLAGTVGRALRGLAGIDHELMQRIWKERARYTALGAVVLSTACIATFSMWNAVNESIGAVAAVSLVPAALWGFFILNFDRWLIAPQPRQRHRVGLFVVRLALAGLVGFVIAEPLILRIFQSAVEYEVKQERSDAIQALTSNLVRCNPDPSAPGAAAGPLPGCDGYLLSFDATPAVPANQLASLRADQQQLQQQVTAEHDQYAALQDKVTSDCHYILYRNGTYGLPSQCYVDRAAVNTFTTTHDLAGDQARLTALNSQISGTEGNLTNAQQTFTNRRDQLIAQKVALQPSPQDAIGFIERWKALEHLTHNDLTVGVGTWVLRLFFISVDCMPVLAKFLGGTSSYDELVEAASTSAIRAFKRKVEAEEIEATTASAMAEATARHEERKHKADLEADYREHMAKMSVRTSQAVAAVERQLRERGSGTGKAAG